MALARAALVVAAAVMLLAPQTAGATSPPGYGQQNSMIFSTQNQSSSGSGSATFTGSQFAIIPYEFWSGSASGGGTWSPCIPVVGCLGTYGAEGSAAGTAGIGMTGYTSSNSGSVNVTYPMQATVHVEPRSGDYVTIDTGWQTSGSPSMSATPMYGQFWVDWTMNLSANVNGEVCVVECAGGGFSTNVGFTNLPLIPEGLVSSSTQLPLGPLVNAALGCGTRLVGPCPPATFNGYVNFPTPDYGTSSASAINGNANQQQVSQSGSDQFLNLGVNAAALLCYYARCTVPLTGQIGEFPFSITGTLLYLGPNISLTYNNDLSFLPKPQITLSLGQSFGYTVLDNGNQVSQGNGSIVTVPVGDSIKLYAPQGQSPVVSELYQMNNQFTSADSLSSAVTIDMWLLELSFGGTSLGPVVSFPSINVASGTTPAGGGSWQLGGFNTATSSFVLDLTPPTINSSMPSANAYGWYNYVPTVNFTCTDGQTGSGVYSCPGAYTFSANQQGQSTTVQSMDNAGNVSSDTVSGINVDTTPPSIVGWEPTAAPDQYGWYNKPVTITLNCTDNLSGVQSCTPVVFNQQGANQSKTGTAIDYAGNVTTVTVNNLGSSVGNGNQAINIDWTPPTVYFLNNNGTYTIADVVNIGCGASDSLSGVASVSCPTIQGPGYNFNLGENTYSASATDKADNIGTGSTSFNVVVTAPSLVTVTNGFTKAAGVNQAIAQKLAGDVVGNNVLMFLHDVSKMEANGQITQKQASLLLEFATNLLGQEIK